MPKRKIQYTIISNFVFRTTNYDAKKSIIKNYKINNTDIFDNLDIALKTLKDRKTATQSSIIKFSHINIKKGLSRIYKITLMIIIKEISFYRSFEIFPNNLNKEEIDKFLILL